MIETKALLVKIFGMTVFLYCQGDYTADIALDVINAIQANSAALGKILWRQHYVIGLQGMHFNECLLGFCCDEFFVISLKEDSACVACDARVRIKI